MYPTPSAAKAAELYGAAAGDSPLIALVAAHDAMIAKLREAQTAILEDRIEDRFELTTKIAAALDILQMSLDHERGGEIAFTLDRLYTHFTRRLHDINIQNDPSICDELVTRFTELRAGWQALLATEGTTPEQPLEAASLSA